MSEENEKELGDMKCDICGAQDTIDINDEAAMLHWMIQHVFGHAGQEPQQQQQQKSEENGSNYTFQ